MTKKGTLVQTAKTSDRAITVNAAKSMEIVQLKLSTSGLIFFLFIFYILKFDANSMVHTLDNVKLYVKLLVILAKI